MPNPEPLSEGVHRRRQNWRPPANPAPSPLFDPVDTQGPPGRDYARLGQSYSRQVLSGAIPAGKWVKLACQRQARDLSCQLDLDWPYVYSEEAVAHVCAFIERLPHVEGRWTTDTIWLEPSQIFFLACLFGWRHRDDARRRRFTSVYYEVGRKGAKSTLMAAIALYHLTEEGESGAQVICGATTGDQARIVFTIAAKMIRRAAWLRAKGLQAWTYSITSEDGAMKAINSKASTQDGLNPSCIILDESHAQKFALYDVLKSAQGARDNPLLLCPTTAGYDLLSVGYALRTTLTKVLEDIYQAEHVFGLIYALDEGDDWTDPALWVKANPMLGVAPKLEQMQRQCLDAQQTPGLEGEFRVKCCSQWHSAASAWLSMTEWAKCADPLLKLEDFTGQPCWIGGDLAQRDDLAAVAYLFQRDQDLVGFVRCYLPALVVDDRARKVPEYRRWTETGDLILTPGDMIEFDQIEADILRACGQFDVRDIAFDQFGAMQMAGTLAAQGWPARTEVKTARSTTPPARELEIRIRHGRFRHDGNSCLAWQASNVVVTRGVDDSILPKKEDQHSPNKIDAIDALLLAIGGWVRATRVPDAVYSVELIG